VRFHRGVDEKAVFWDVSVCRLANTDVSEKALKIEAARSSETLVINYQSTRCNIKKVSIFNSLNFHIKSVLKEG
jgi:hypothetical protein